MRQSHINHYVLRITNKEARRKRRYKIHIKQCELKVNTKLLCELKTLSIHANNTNIHTQIKQRPHRLPKGFKGLYE